MKDVQFEGNLKNDIKLSKAKFNLPKKILGAIIFNIICFGMITIPLVMLNALPLGFQTLAMLIPAYTVGVIYSTYYDNKKFQQSKSKAITRLNDLIQNLQNENVNASVKSLQNAQIEETKVSTTKEAGNNKFKEQIIDRTIYFLDDSHKLQMLNETRRKTDKNGEIEKSNNVMLFEEEDLQKVTQNAEKRLVLKR